MRSGRFVLAGTLFALCALAGTACSKNPGGGTPTVTGVSVSGSGALTQVGQTTQLSASAALSDGSAQDVTSKVTWQVTDSSIASVSPAGLVTGIAFGSTTVKATYQGFTGQITMTLQINVNGTWKGTTADSTGILQVTFVLVQNGSALTGTGVFTFTNGVTGNGTFTGTVSTTSNAVLFDTGGSGAGCTFTAKGSGTVTGNTFNGTYTGNNSCVGPLNNGVMSLTKQ